MVHPYFSRISCRVKKKRRNGCHKTKLGNRHLVLIGEKNEIWPHFTYWVYSKQLVLTLWLKKYICIQRWRTFWGSYLQRLQVSIMYSSYRKCGSCHNVSKNVQSCVKHQTYCFSLKWRKLSSIKLYSWSSFPT